MNTPSNVTPEAPLQPPSAPAPIPATRLFYWSVQREIWEYRSIYLAPLVVAGVVLFGFLISLITLPHRANSALLRSPADQAFIFEHPFVLAELAIMAAALIVAILYCIEALHGERRDRSILFWKSLPVSDLITVLAKASVPLVILPMVAFVVTEITEIIMVLLSAMALMGNPGESMLWAHVHFVHMSWGLFYHLLFIHGFWYAPFYGWFLLVSAWAKRAPFLWATLPPILAGILERIIFGSTCFASTIGNHFFGGPDAPKTGQEAMTLDAMTHPGPSQYFTSPGFWIGLLVTATFLALAVRLRRYREPI
jgi:ABC-2 type transport system permease protein